ncbi:hypothetical protein DF185_22600 [Marinifilum breve]|uniref:Cell wall anchor protein n=1 Tax=Marinifilum breve TaxID=2184082 RepID=A0A2V3ZQA2_9BACT|nr:hypothetical protein [Marinifilum breve]PXX95172.1 hypothetical protein DF185_22600 [Marinifilum breve]
MTNLKYVLALAIAMFCGEVYAQVATSIKVVDTRDIVPLPTDYNAEVKFEFKHRGTISVPGAGSYSGLFTIAPWSDNSGNKTHQLNFNDGGLFYRNALPENSSWGTWKKVLMLDSDNRLGIGTESPLVKFHVGGSSIIEQRIQLGNYQSTWLNDQISGYSNGIHITDAALFVPVHLNSASDLRMYIVDDSNDAFSIWGNTCVGGSCGDLNAASQIVRFEGGGNVLFNGNIGVGVTFPTAKIDVDGTIRATEIKVQAQTADFVFEDSYELKKLSEVEQFITTNKHLPDIPSAKQMEENGVGLSEMNKLLLQKVEELTLYVIELKKENERCHARIDSLVTIQP